MAARPLPGSYPRSRRLADNSFFDQAESDSDDEDGEAIRAREANRKRVRNELERAAGGPLTET